MFMWKWGCYNLLILRNKNVIYMFKIIKIIMFFFNKNGDEICYILLFIKFLCLIVVKKFCCLRWENKFNIILVIVGNLSEKYWDVAKIVIFLRD